MITQYYNPDWDLEWRVTIPARRAWENMDAIFAWAKEYNLKSFTRGDAEWLFHEGEFIVGVPTQELALEFQLRFG